MRKLSALALLIGLTALAGCSGREPPAPPAAGSSTAGAAAPTDAAATETARLGQWLDARFEEELAFSPIYQTVLGRKTDYDKLDDASESAEDEQLAWRRGTVEQLEREFAYDALTADGKLSYDLWVYRLDQAEAAAPFRRRYYLFNQMDGPHTGLPQILINFHRVDDESDMRAYVARIGEIGRSIGQSLDRAKRAASEGVHAPRFAYEAVVQQSRALVTGAPFDGVGDAPIWSDANTKIDALAAAGKLDEPTAEALRAAARTALLEKFKPAYDALIAWAQADIANSDEVATGVWKLPDGPAFYAERLANSTTTNMTADEIHELGLREVERIKGEMETLERQVGFDGSLQDFFAFMRTDPQFYFPNTDAGREAYLDAARQHLAFIKERLPQYFGRLPKAGLIVKRVEAFREQPGAAQHYFPGTPDGSRPGIFYAHLIDMSSMPKPQLEDVAYHEGIPGHHLQISIAQELTGVPLFRTQTGFTAYVEGWGLYAEQLAKEMGAYQDPYSDFGRLSAEMWRAVRLVVDTGLHAKGWTEAQAEQYFRDNSANAEGQIVAEVRRYIVTPGQATAYKVGMLEILELRSKARATLGDKFDIRAFHDIVLGGGALPLSLLERRVNRWIAEQQAL